MVSTVAGEGTRRSRGRHADPDPLHRGPDRAAARTASCQAPRPMALTSVPVVPNGRRITSTAARRAGPRNYIWTVLLVAPRISAESGTTTRYRPPAWALLIPYFEVARNVAVVVQSCPSNICTSTVWRSTPPRATVSALADLRARLTTACTV